jgi:MoxR-like ATPase
MRIRLGYPAREDEVAILDSQAITHPIEAIDQVVDADDLMALHRRVREIRVDDAVRQYIVDVVAATRVHPDVYLGASPRGSLGLYRTAQASALLKGRDYVIPDDVKPLVEPVLAHRVIMNPAARVRNVQSGTVLDEILHTVAVPGTRVPA